MKRYSVVPTKQYRKDFKRLMKSGKDRRKLEDVIDTLAKGKKLPAKNRDHALKGEFKDMRECHIAPDWLLLYQRNDEELILLLIWTGPHRDVLGRE